MELKPGLSALVTGGGSGIGKALSIALGKKGIFVTVIDYSAENAKEVASLVEKECAKFHSGLKFPPTLFVRCDVANTGNLAITGISNPIPFNVDTSDGTASCRRTIDVNLVAVIDCTRLAIQSIQAGRKPGVIINLGSASCLYPMYADPIYSGTKGQWCRLFTRSLALYKRQGIRVNLLCPEFVETEMGRKIDPKFIDSIGGFIPMEMVVNGAVELIKDESKAGSCLWISKRRGMEYWPTPAEEAKYLVLSSRFKRGSSYNAPNLQVPQSYEKLIVHTLTHNFRNATKIVRTQLKLPIKLHRVLVKIIYAGVNYSSGRYFSNDKELASRLPLDSGFEGVGLIAAVGDSVNHLKIGSPVALMTFGSYSEFTEVLAKHVLPVPRPDPEVVAMLTSGLTASIALEKSAHMESGKVVLVTAAAGGTGQFAVQLAKLAGNTVVAICGGEKKASLLKDLGVDRVIDYRSENMKAVCVITSLKLLSSLRRNFPKVLISSMNLLVGEMFDPCFNALAVYGRLVVIGMISQYQGEHGWQPSNYTGLCDKILAKSQTVSGFFLVQYSHLWQQHLDRLFHLFSSGKLKVFLDPKKFTGVESVANAVEYLHSGKSVGKVVVCIDPNFSQQVAKL
ncbi:hypothetical protein MKX01_005901 [Papaver californicum]|nr:hypothetical protein MKX01_005901 [Papaver californicum]